MHYFSNLSDKALYMFRTVLLSIIRSISWWWTVDFHRDVFLQWKPSRFTVSQIYLTKSSTCFGRFHCPSSGVSPDDGQWTCIVMYSYNESHRDSLFLRFIWQSNLHVSDESTVHHQEYLLMMDSGLALWCILTMKANEIHYFSYFFDKVLYMFRTSPLSIIRSISWWWTVDLHRDVFLQWKPTRCTISQLYLRAHCPSSGVSPDDGLVRNM